MRSPASSIIFPVDDYSKLGADVEAAMDGLVESGRYPTREDVLREGVRLLQDREARLARVDTAVSRGIEDAEAGRSEDADIVLTQLRRKYEPIVAKPAA